MKKILFALAGFLMSANLASAQPDEGAKLAKGAGKALTSYNMDPAGNTAKLEEAKQKIEEALKLPDAQAIASAWITKGDIYNTLLNRDLAKRMIDPKAPLTGDNDALAAFEAYKKGYEISTKKYEKSDAIKGINEVYGHLINIGVSKYEAKEYDKSFHSFQATLQAHDLLKENKMKSFLDEPGKYDEQMYSTALIATLAGRNADAIKYFEILYKKGSDNPSVYDGLYNAKVASGDEAGANEVLTEGRKKFPDDSALLFSEINSYLKSGRLAELTGRLEQAIRQEPNNVGLYVTLGNVYDNLYQAMQKEKNDAKAKEYFELAKAQYATALEKDPKNADANYSLGALYYNQAAVRTQEMNALPDDFSSAGLKKMQTMRDEVMSLFDQALPYFQKAESLNPNDLSTLIALNEIYARKEDELSSEFKKRLEVVKAGGKNPASHFKM
jgi:tetratricopeptide (TPR) repeat protein